MGKIQVFVNIKQCCHKVTTDLRQCRSDNTWKREYRDLTSTGYNYIYVNDFNI